MKTIITGLLAITVMAASAFAGNPDTRANLISLFSDRHYTADEEAIKKAGEDVPGTLKEMAGDESLLTFIRMRAVNALGFFSNEDVGEFLQATASSSVTRVGIRSEAITALSNSQGDKSTKFIAGFLKDSDTLMRSSAANSLRRVGSPSAKAALRQVGGDDGGASTLKPLD
ncbi:hypothetical protein MNBD_NITROSPINAE02-247 [hydrothermal vent metagenome]|uniref:HEAT repeat domain-containing protein n=1 Tax=hydrothermal vent metagenome TaxID=652676 RepID=A0A3B1CQ95_9ZZZZ